MTERETERYQRNLLVEGFSATGQQRLSESRVTVVGAGGLGSATLNYLAAAGVGRLRIVENDTVSLSNLQRQILYTTADLDAPKAEVAAARLSRLNPACRIEIRTDRLDGGNADEILSDCDVVVDCTDNYATRYAIDDFCSARRIPMVYGTAEQIGGQIFIEPSRVRDAVIVGPHMFNFTDAMNRAKKADAVIQINDIEELEETVTQLLSNKELLEAKRSLAYNWANGEAKVLDGIVEKVIGFI